MLKAGACLVGFGFFAVAGLAAPATSLSAASLGCCLQRQSPSDSSPWIQVSTDFNDCQRLNQQMDGNDNILEPLGLIRWSIEC